MSEIMDQYEKLYTRLDDSESWISSKNITWEECRTKYPKAYKLRQDIFKEIELIQNTLKRGK